MDTKKNLKSSKVIIDNSVVILLFIATLVIQNIYFLDKNNDVLSSININHNHKLDLIMLMSKSARERSLSMVEMYLSTDPWERDKVFSNFHKLKLVFINQKDELQKLGLANNEKIIFDQIMSIIRTTEPLQNNIVNRIHSDEEKNVRSDISEKDFPLENKLLVAFDALAATTRKNADIARNEAYQQHLSNMMLVILVSGLVCLGLIFIMRKSLYKIKTIESELILEAESLGWDATHDALTDTYNRRWIQNKIESLLEVKGDEIIQHSLLYLDLDNFKPVNDAHGHMVGDKFLCDITHELEKCIRQHDSLARMGGDEFAILLENCDSSKAASIAECIIKNVNIFFIMVDGKKIAIDGCSIGVTEFGSRITNYDDIINQADSACYYAKRNGKNKIHVDSLCTI